MRQIDRQKESTCGSRHVEQRPSCLDTQANMPPAHLGARSRRATSAFRSSTLSTSTTPAGTASSTGAPGAACSSPSLSLPLPPPLLLPSLLLSLAAASSSSRSAGELLRLPLPPRGLLLLDRWRLCLDAAWPLLPGTSPLSGDEDLTAGVAAAAGAGWCLRRTAASMGCPPSSLSLPELLLLLLLGLLPLLMPRHCWSHTVARRLHAGSKVAAVGSGGRSGAAAGQISGVGTPCERCSVVQCSARTCLKGGSGRWGLQPQPAGPRPPRLNAARACTPWSSGAVWVNRLTTARRCMLPDARPPLPPPGASGMLSPAGRFHRASAPATPLRWDAASSLSLLPATIHGCCGKSSCLGACRVQPQPRRRALPGRSVAAGSARRACSSQLQLAFFLSGCVMKGCRPSLQAPLKVPSAAPATCPRLRPGRRCCPWAATRWRAGSAAGAVCHAALGPSARACSQCALVVCLRH